MSGYQSGSVWLIDHVTVLVDQYDQMIKKGSKFNLKNNSLGKTES